MLELANLNLDGIAGMRSGGSVLKVPQAPMRGHSPASIVRGAGCAELYREHHPRAGHAERGGSVLKATGPFTYWGAAEGALPRE